jgi:hypothetical protein
VKTAIEVYNPKGTTELTSKHAPRLRSLAGKTICELSNGGWEANRILPHVSELLQKQFPDIKIIPYTEFPVGREQIDVENIGELVKSKGCDGAIVGNAA